MQNPFENLIPQQPQPSPQQDNPFAHLIPQDQPQGPTAAQIDRASLVPEFMGHGAANIMSLGRGILNIPNKINPNVFAPLADPNRNYYHEMGVEENTGDQISKALVEYLPFMKGAQIVTGAASKIPAIARFAAANPRIAALMGNAGGNPIENMLGGAAHGAVNSDPGNGADGALLGALFGGVASPLGALGSAGGSWLAKKYAQSAIPEFTKKAADKLREIAPLDKFSGSLSNKYLDALKANKNDWNVADKTAKSLDEAGNTFNQDQYLKYVNDYQSKIKGLEPALKTPYTQSSGVAEQLSAKAPQSFEGLIGARKDMNQGIKDYLSEGGKAINPENRETKNFLTGLKNNLKNETLQSQEGNVGKDALEDFRNKWEAANKSTQGLQEFYKSFQNSTGTVKPTRQMRERFQNVVRDNPTDPNVIGKFMPNLTEKGSKGIEGFKHLENLLGSKEDAQNAAKAFLFQKQIGNGANTVDTAAQYGKLSPQQRKYLFGDSEEGKMLETINNTRLAFNREPEKTWSKNLHAVGSWTLPGALAGGTTLYNGEGWDKAAVNAALATGASKGLGLIASKTATPALVNKAIQRAQEGAKNKSRYLNLIAQNLNPYTREAQ